MATEVDLDEIFDGDFPPNSAEAGTRETLAVIDKYLAEVTDEDIIDDLHGALEVAEGRRSAQEEVQRRRQRNTG